MLALLDLGRSTLPMVGMPKDLAHVAAKGFKLRVTCRRCRHQRDFEPAALGVELMRRRKSTAWESLPYHFRCGCGAKRPRVLPA